jgi:Ni2+-binding GTPase involved in maturation of urease and hydrogenase
MTRNPFHITYTDLINYVQHNVQRMEKTYPAMKMQGKINANTATHNIECAKTLLRMLKKHDKNRQLNLNDLFEQMK